jgi:hypothetical protein
VRRPPDPFDPATAALPAGHLLYRVLSATRTATDFNPGLGSALVAVISEAGGGFNDSWNAAMHNPSAAAASFSASVVCLHFPS